MNIYKLKKNNGFSLIEVMIACSIILISVLATTFGINRGLQLSEFSLRQVQASFLLEEGAEAVKIIRDQSWSNITNAISSNNYLNFDQNTNLWSLTQAPNTIDSIFTRTIDIESVKRDNNSKDIDEAGSYSDSGTKKVTVTVFWTSPGGTRIKTLTFYLSDIFS